MADGTYRCLVANRPADGSGHLLLFKSNDIIHWEFEKVFAENKRRYGLMWECPDFFELDGKGVLFASPQDMLPEGFEFHNGNGNICMIKWSLGLVKCRCQESFLYGMEDFASGL